MRNKERYASALLGMLLALFWGVSVYANEVPVLRLATTTSTYETGLLDALLPLFEQKYKVSVHTLSVGTGKAIATARNGDVDVILVHDRPSEDAFVAEGYGVNRRAVMVNDFVLLGPAQDPAGVSRAAGIVDAFRRMDQNKALFISRGDESGTHKREKSLWKKAGVVPSGSHYLEAGIGMTATLQMADEKRAYVLSDRATFDHFKTRTELKILFEGDQLLLNPYGIIAVSPYRHPHVRYELAMSLIAWLTSPEVQKKIAAYRKNGAVLYTPNAHLLD